MIKRLLFFACVAMFLFTYGQTKAQGTWHKVTNLAPLPEGGGMVLLTDGTVMCKTYSAAGWPAPDSGWIMLTPDIHGSYVNGTWSVLPNMHWGRFAFSTQVLPNGNLYVAGSEHGNGTNNAEIYNTVTKTWTPIPNVPGYDIEDANSELLYDGTVLEGCANPYNPPIDTINMFYSPVTGQFSVAPASFKSHEEVSWLKLPDSSILFVDAISTTSERYIPQQHKWVHDANVPVNIYDPSSYETGPALMLPNGKGFFIGDVQYTALYTPSGNTGPGTWAAGPQMPVKPGIGQLGSWDGSAAAMADGKVLCVLSGIAANSMPTFFYEYDYLTNSFTEVGAPGGGDSVQQWSNFTTMLDLPDGSVLFAYTDSTQFYVYTPAGAPIAQGKPTIDGVFPDTCNYYMLTGKLFNGISQGACFGDDWQMATNYPIVRLTDGTNVYYCKTYNWNRLGALMTGSAEDTAYFSLPSLPGGTYSLVVVANGNPSNPVPFSTFGVAITSQTNITGCSGLGGATAYASNGNPPYTYLWSNGTTTASDTNLTAGIYTVTVTQTGGCTASATVTITQPGNISLNATVTEIPCNGGNTGSISTAPSGGAQPYTYTWSTGATTASITGLTAGSYSITVVDSCGFTASASISVTQPPALSAIINWIFDETCYGDSTGSIYSYVTGGTTPYTYNWSPSGGNNYYALGLKAGTYTMTVRDACNATVTVSATVTQPAGMTIIADSVSVTTMPTCNGKAKVTVSGGNPPYTYLWSPGGQTADSIYNQCPGTYCCTITDNIGCSQSRCIVINNTTGVENMASGQEQVTVYPNPSNGMFNLSITNVSSVMNDYVEIYNILGEKVYSEAFSTFNSPVSINLASQPAGIYMYRVVTGAGRLAGEGKFVIDK